ncbi:132 kDa protein [Symbiodinium microadriaticum]|uniref:132 kDa protein n=1 Tax=Symbiodinium microadriaticum TaxID=2951 RepID=A0A1Q9DS37_SYMMI|nr:132 kDa protein [Symbiodinium microadriaticum]
MLLARTTQRGAQGRQELLARAAAFQRGDWALLLDEARRAGSCRPQSGAQSLDAETVAERKREQACTKVRAGELSRARQLLTAAEIAPGNEDTWRALTDPARRPPEPRTPIPRAVVEQRSAGQVQLGPTAVAAALRDARRGGAAGLSGMRAEHLKILLADVPALELLAFAATELANAHVPADIATGLALARLTALRKPDGGVRGIATGDVFRRLVSRVLAKTWANVFDEATRPFQYALQARAGTDALAAHVRTVLEWRDDAVLVSLDGRSAYDTMSRASFLSALHSAAPELVPFVRLFYGQPSTYCWWDNEGNCRNIAQGEGCEQGDPLALNQRWKAQAAFAALRAHACSLLELPVTGPSDPSDDQEVPLGELPAGSLRTGPRRDEAGGKGMEMAWSQHSSCRKATASRLNLPPASAKHNKFATASDCELRASANASAFRLLKRRAYDMIGIRLRAVCKDVDAAAVTQGRSVENRKFDDYWTDAADTGRSQRRGSPNLAMDEVVKTAVETLAADSSNFVEISKIKGDAKVRSYFRRVLFKPPWEDATWVMYFQSRPTMWEFDEKIMGAKVKSDLATQIEEAARLKRRKAAFPEALYTAVLRAGTPVETSAVIANSKDSEIAALPMDAIEALIGSLGNLPESVDPPTLQKHAEASVKVITAVPGSLEKKGATLGDIMRFFDMVMKFQPETADQRLTHQRILTLRELCEAAARDIRKQGVGATGTKALGLLCSTAPFHILALTLAGFGTWLIVSGLSSHLRLR